MSGKNRGTGYDFSAVPTVLGVSVIGGIGYYRLFADSATTFPARSTVPSWWTGRVVYDSFLYLDHPDPTDRVTGDVHEFRSS